MRATVSTVHGECAEGQLCDGGACRSDGRPRIVQVHGAGSLACPAAAANRCLVSRLVVEGHNLRNAGFSLNGSGKEEVLGANLADHTRVELELPAAFVPGSYVLVANNAVGSDTENLLATGGAVNRTGMVIPAADVPNIQI